MDLGTIEKLTMAILKRVLSVFGQVV